jgi:putative glutamine amidotransferase
VRPIIGITADYDPAESAQVGEVGDSLHFLHDDLVRTVAATGGTPLLIPCSREETLLESFLQVVHGLIFSGSGADLDPRHYGEEPLEALGRPNPERLDFDLALARRALAGSLPLLGICGGLQTLNVASGGTLYQDIGSQLPGALQHKPGGLSSEPAHSVSIKEGSRLEGIVGRRNIEVNSTHHQAVKAPGEPFRVVAEAPDGVVEAVEGPAGRFLLGLQWHPEYMAGECQASRSIFEALVEASKAYAEA